MACDGFGDELGGFPDDLSGIDGSGTHVDLLWLVGGVRMMGEDGPSDEATKSRRAGNEATAEQNAWQRAHAQREDSAGDRGAQVLIET